MFLGLILEERGFPVLEEHGFLSCAACACVIIGSKIHESKPLGTTNFSLQNSEHLVEFEKSILSKCGCTILSQGTPSATLEHMLQLLPAESVSSECKETALAMSSDLIASFQETSEYLCYAPVTISVSALLLSFSKLQIDCSEWLRRIPDVCLPKPDHPFFEPNQLAFLDADGCIQCLQQFDPEILCADQSCTPNSKPLNSLEETDTKTIGDARASQSPTGVNEAFPFDRSQSPSPHTKPVERSQTSSPFKPISP
jgi:hypothetical protein